MSAPHRINLILSKKQTSFLNDLSYRQLKKTDKKVSMSLAIRAAVENFKKLSVSDQDAVIENQLLDETRGSND